MIHYNRDPQTTIPTSAVKIIGLGGAGTNMLARIAGEGMEDAELLAIHTDLRTLNSCLVPEKIQLGLNLTKGLGAGGDPELGRQAVLEAEDQIRASIQGRRIIFLCTGLGGGTSSGAAPIVTRIAREQGAFVVVFATMPFAFEGKRRREQAETALNELAVLSSALVTFDNNRMGELILAQQGIHEAFTAADQMICESIKAVIRLVVRPGLINIGLDDLMSALRTNRSRCLFGSGIADGMDRATQALQNALSSPLLDQGALLKDAQTVLVHLCGGVDLTLFEIELLMQCLQKFVPENAHVLFGAAIDPAMGHSLSITLISALPEDSMSLVPRDSPDLRSQGNPAADAIAKQVAIPAESACLPQTPLATADDAELQLIPTATQSLFDSEIALPEVADETPAPSEESEPQRNLAAFTFTDPAEPESAVSSIHEPDAENAEDASTAAKPEMGTDPELPKLKLGVKSSISPSELSFDSAPRGRFEGETPNVFEGEDLDLPPFLRKKK